MLKITDTVNGFLHECSLFSSLPYCERLLLQRGSSISSLVFTKNRFIFFVGAKDKQSTMVDYLVLNKII